MAGKAHVVEHHVDGEVRTTVHATKAEAHARGMELRRAGGTAYVFAADSPWRSGGSNGTLSAAAQRASSATAASGTAGDHRAAAEANRAAGNATKAAEHEKLAAAAGSDDYNRDDQGRFAPK